MKRLIKIGIVGASPVDCNRGVEALAYSTLYLLNDFFEKRNEKVEIFYICDSYGNMRIAYPDKEISVNTILEIDLFNIPRVLYLLRTPTIMKSFMQYIKIDYILSISGGDSFSDIYGVDRFKIIDNQHRLARLFHKPYMILPQTIGPFTNDKIKKKAIKSIESSKFVLARDFKSYNYIIKNTKQKHIKEIIDMAFFMPYKKREKGTNNIDVGISISDMLWISTLHKNIFELKCDYHKLTYQIIDYFLSIHNVTIYLTPHVISDRVNTENDYLLSYDLCEEYNNERVRLSPFFLSPIMAKNFISKLDFFVGARMHATIAAFSSGVPVVPLSYSRKFTGLFNDTLNYPYVGDMKAQKNINILQIIEKSFIKRVELKSVISNRLVNFVEERKKSLFDCFNIFFNQI